jgi:hypothetical protein
MYYLVIAVYFIIQSKELKTATAKLQVAQIASGLALLMANGFMVSCSTIRGSAMRVLRLR